MEGRLNGSALKITLLNCSIEVEWQINPDGRYYADDDGFGMTNDREVSLYSYIDRAGRPLVKFSHVGDDLSRLDRMRAEALKR